MLYQIPQLDMYSNTQQLHGIHAQHIKNEWPCQQHLGENGRPGACYITPNGVHIGLNIRRLAAWAAAIFYAGLISQLITIVLRLPEKPRNTSHLIFLTLMVRTMVGEPCQGPEDEQGLQHSPQWCLRLLLQTKL